MFALLLPNLIVFGSVRPGHDVKTRGTLPFSKSFWNSSIYASTANIPDGIKFSNHMLHMLWSF